MNSYRIGTVSLMLVLFGLAIGCATPAIGEEKDRLAEVQELIEQKQYAEAVAKCSQVIRASGNDGYRLQAHVGRGLASALMGENDRALSDFCYLIDRRVANLPYAGLKFFPLASFSLSNFGSFLAASEGGQQSSNPLQNKPITIEYYYKLIPGGAAEWLALYRKNHHPILKELAKDGLILSEKLYERRFHAVSPAWDYKVVMVWRDWTALQQAGPREDAVTSVLYSDREEHAREEKHRWELTVEHWDDVLKEVPLD